MRRDLLEVPQRRLVVAQHLELVLRVTRPGKGGLNRDARAGYGFGRGRATVPVGSGY